MGEDSFTRSDNRDDRVLILGSTGLIGTAISSEVRRCGYSTLLADSRTADLRDAEQTRRLINETAPTLIIHAAGDVGGIEANLRYGRELGLANALMTVNVLSAAMEQAVEKLIFLGSSCAYPNDRTQHMTPDDLFAGPIESSSRSYALAKCLGMDLVIRAREDGMYWTTVIPANVYGPHDNFDAERAHVVAALIRKFHYARTTGASDVVLWGSGMPVRQFIHSSDLASAIVVVVDHLQTTEATLNVASDRPCTIAALAGEVADATGYEGHTSWDPRRPDGTPVKLLDDSSIRQLGWHPDYDLRVGLLQTYEWFTGAIAADAVHGYRESEVAN